MPAQTCFVIMGFGRKTDYSATAGGPRTLNMDGTYEAIIKPAVTDAGLRCVRADEISQSGLIDRAMYQMLLTADLVIADISTANPNALYELGVRHALRPRTTIVIKEIDGDFPFDLNHVATLRYKHLGDDIGMREGILKRAELGKLITEVMSRQDDDSPVYTFLRNLEHPKLSASVPIRGATFAVQQSNSVAAELEAARQAAARKPFADHALARQHYARAIAIQAEATSSAAHKADPYLVQQLALHTYKAKLPNPVAALEEAWRILGPLHPESSTDPETVGIAGAIQKRLCELENDTSHLELAIDCYRRGFELRNDYYNGENYAICLDRRSRLQVDPAEAMYDRRTATKVREKIVATLTSLLEDRANETRSDYHWMLAAMANVGYALGRPDAAEYEARFRALGDRLEPWMLATFDAGKEAALALRAERNE